VPGRIVEIYRLSRHKVAIFFGKNGEIGKDVPRISWKQVRPKRPHAKMLKNDGPLSKLGG
jgi:hypothetical protein